MSRGPLDVWLYGTRLAQLRETPTSRLRLTWSEDAVRRWGRGARLLSSTLPIGDDPVPALVKVYLDGLLPEGNARVNHALSAGIAPDDTFALIAAYGRDTPGAAIFVPEGTTDPTSGGHYEPLTLEQVADRLRRADQHQPSSPQETTESSTLPGMVPKITVHRQGRTWFACKEGAPSTWILKRAQARDTGISDVVDTEVACLALARRLGLTTIAAEVVDLGDLRAIAVSRYDRDPVHGNARIHQEDLAQATGLNTSDPNRKFQWGSAMPSLRDASQVLRRDGAKPDELLRLATFTHLVGNTDMHAKNISFLRLADGRVQLSPAYDIAMHLHHERDNRRFALDVNGKWQVELVTIADLIAEGVAWGLPATRARRAVIETQERLAQEVQVLDRAAHPGVPERAWDVFEQRLSRARQQVVELGLTTVPTTAPRQTEAVRRPGRRGPRRPRGAN